MSLSTEAERCSPTPSPCQRPRRAASKRVSYAQSSEDDDDTSDFDETRTRPAKRARRGGRKSRATSGLEKLVDMPLDFIYLLVCKLHPLDLLHMARTCNGLRGFFMSRNSERFWQAASKNIDGLPPPPEGSCWPAYIAFMFSSSCHHCGRNGCDAMFWDCLARYCYDCKMSLSVLHTRKYDAVRTLGTSLSGVSIPFPFDQIPLHFLVPVMDTEHKKFASSNGIMDRFKSHEGWNYSKVQLDRLQDAMAKLPPEQVCSFIEAKAKALRTRREQTPLLVRWKKEEKAIRAGERQYAQAQRHQAIKQKLIDLGWGEELDMVDEEEFRLHPLVAQPKPLTERIWNGIKTQMIDYMVECQQGRLYDERGDLVRQRLRALQRATASTLYNNEDGPSLYQIATGIPEITKILRLPEDVVIDEESFDWVLSELPSFIDNWKNTVRTRLSNLVRANVDIAETTDPFALAVAVSFRCKRCLGLFRPPWLFSHHCTVPLRPSSAELDYCTALIAETFTDQQCESDDFKDLAEIRKHVIALCGEDPKTATADELDSSAVRLTCPQHNYTGVISVMTWSAMVEHYRLHHRTLSDLGQLQVVPERFREIYRRLERITWSSAENKLANMNVWQCLHCKSRRLMTLSQITHHMLFQSLISPSTHPSDRRTDERKNMKCVRDCPEVVYLFDASMRVELDDLYHSLSDWTAATFVEL